MEQTIRRTRLQDKWVGAHNLGAIGTYLDATHIYAEYLLWYPKGIEDSHKVHVDSL